MSLCIENFLVETTASGTPLKATIKRYSFTSGKHEGPGIILLFAHGTGFHKEHWEPTIEHLFQLSKQDAERIDTVRIHEAWAIDCQNHGDAAVLNEKVLLRHPGVLTTYDYGDAFASLYKSGLMGKIDPAIHRTILVGHSAGAVAAILATSFFNPPTTIPFDSLILIEPPIHPRAMVGRETMTYKAVAKNTPLRRDIWGSTDSAKRWLQKRPPWNMWDKRVLDIYVGHGLRPLPTLLYPDIKDGVTMKCTKSDEAVAYSSGPREGFHALYRLNQICDALPVHLVFGSKNDLFSREVQDSLIDPLEGRNVASVTRVSGAGHLVVQEAPDRLADVLFAILKKGAAASLSSKL